MPSIKTGLGPNAAEIYYEIHGDAEAGDRLFVAGDLDCCLPRQKPAAASCDCMMDACLQGGNKHAGSQTLPGHDHG